MFFILSKTISYLLLPVSLLTICLLLYLFTQKKALKKWAGILFLCLFFLFTNPFIINQLMQWWEIGATPIEELNEQYDAAIILSGVTASGQAPLDRVHLHKGADRIMHTVQLYKLGRVKKIIVSGGSGLLLDDPDSRTEASQIGQILLISGVQPADILLEEESRNTRENAINSLRLLEGRPDIARESLLLVTSAFHMRRALGCFQQAGLSPQPYSTDFYSDEQEYTPDALIIPTDGALPSWTRLTKEWIGYLAYRLMGYL